MFFNINQLLEDVVNLFPFNSQKSDRPVDKVILKIMQAKKSNIHPFEQSFSGLVQQIKVNGHRKDLLEVFKVLLTEYQSELLDRIEKYPEAFRHAFPKLRENEEFVKKAILINPEVFRYTSFKVKGNMEIALEAINGNSELFHLVDPKLKENREFLLEVLAIDPTIVKYLSSHSDEIVNDEIFRQCLSEKSADKLKGIRLTQKVISDSRIRARIRNAGKNLKELDLWGYGFVLNELKEIFLECPNLKRLYIIDARVSDEFLQILPEGLVELAIVSCNLNHLQYVPRDVKKLYVSNNPELRDEHLLDLPSKLEFLDIYNCDVSQEMIVQLEKKITKVKWKDRY